MALGELTSPPLQRPASRGGGARAGRREPHGERSKPSGICRAEGCAARRRAAGRERRSGRVQFGNCGIHRSSVRALLVERPRAGGTSEYARNLPAPPGRGPRVRGRALRARGCRSRWALEAGAGTSSTTLKVPDGPRARRGWRPQRRRRAPGRRSAAVAGDGEAAPLGDGRRTCPRARSRCRARRRSRSAARRLRRCGRRGYGSSVASRSDELANLATRAAVHSGSDSVRTPGTRAVGERDALRPATGRARQPAGSAISVPETSARSAAGTVEAALDRDGLVDCGRFVSWLTTTSGSAACTVRITRVGIQGVADRGDESGRPRAVTRSSLREKTVTWCPASTSRLTRRAADRARAAGHGRCACARLGTVTRAVADPEQAPGLGQDGGVSEHTRYPGAPPGWYPDPAGGPGPALVGRLCLDRRRPSLPSGTRHRRHPGRVRCHHRVPPAKWRPWAVATERSSTYKRGAGRRRACACAAWARRGGRAGRVHHRDLVIWRVNESRYLASETSSVTWDDAQHNITPPPFHDDRPHHPRRAPRQPRVRRRVRRRLMWQHRARHRGRRSRSGGRANRQPGEWARGSCLSSASGSLSARCVTACRRVIPAGDGCLQLVDCPRRGRGGRRLRNLCACSPAVARLPSPSRRSCEPRRHRLGTRRRRFDRGPGDTDARERQTHVTGVLPLRCGIQRQLPSRI